MSRRLRFRWLEIGIGLAVAIVVLAEFTVYSPPVQKAEHSLRVGAQLVEASADSATVRLSVADARYQQDLQVVAFQLATKPIRQRAIHVYTDAGFPTAGVAGTVVQGVFDHLAGELLAHGYHGSIEAVTAGQLTEVLHTPARASGQAVVMMTGVLPASVFSKKVDLLTPWVEAGGLAVWGGAPIGYYSAEKGQSLAETARLSYAEKGPEVLVGKKIFTFPWSNQRVAAVQGDMAVGLGITYRLASAGLARNGVLAQRGVGLGWSAGPYSSLMYLPRGAGGYLLFGGEILDEAAVAHDIAQIVLSNADSASGLVTSRELHLSRSVPAANLNWHLPFGYSQAGIMLVVFDLDPDGTFFFSEILSSSGL